MAWSSEDNGWVVADPDDLLATAVSLEWASTLLFMLDILVNERRVLLLHTNCAMRVLYIIIYTQKERWGLKKVRLVEKRNGLLGWWELNTDVGVC